MVQLTVSLPDSVKAYIDEQIASGRCTSADELFVALIEQEQEQEQEQRAKQQVNRMLRSRLQDEKWSGLRRLTSGGISGARN
ncbi:MAG: hypothetical protein MUF49_27425 [Oculatellaceae cyanobacterium Prado106]|nr:hypothetical protein [Oculatellaceae cyanobacterium Prado106]